MIIVSSKSDPVKRVIPKVYDPSAIVAEHIVVFRDYILPYALADPTRTAIDIARHLSVSAPYVTKAFSEAREVGYLPKENTYADFSRYALKNPNCLTGHSQISLAMRFGVSATTLREWVSKYKIDNPSTAR